MDRHRAYYVVTGDSDKDDDVTTSCYSHNDDVIRNCSSTSGTAVPFRLLRAYHSAERRRRRPKASRRRNTTAAMTPSTPPSAGTMTSLPVPVANSHDVVAPEVKEEVEYRAVTSVDLDFDL